MILSAASLAFRDLFTPPFRSVLIRSLSITLALLVVVWLIGRRLITGYGLGLVGLDGATGGYGGLVATAAAILSGMILAAVLAFMVAPVTAVVASVFLDDIAEVVEVTHYPADRPGQAMPFLPGLIAALRFTGLVIVVNLICLVLLIVPGVNLIAFFLGNGYLLGREYFTLAALRLRPADEVARLRAANGTTILLTGLVIAGVLAVPVLNLLTPLFATAIMVHVNKQLTGSRPVTV